MAMRPRKIMMKRLKLGGARGVAGGEASGSFGLGNSSDSVGSSDSDSSSDPDASSSEPESSFVESESPLTDSPMDLLILGFASARPGETSVAFRGRGRGPEGRLDLRREIFIPLGKSLLLLLERLDSDRERLLV